MDWEQIVEAIPAVIAQIRTDYILNNNTIRDDIFGILEKYCHVIYYPLENEKNCGFHTKRFLNGKLEDFVYINTAKPIADQVFAAAHELGHVWGVAEKVCAKTSTCGPLTEQEEELIINRFAAELLMPEDEFKKTFHAHMKELHLDPTRITLEDLIRVIVMQMNDFMVPYESVRRRLIETGIITSGVGSILDSNQTIIYPLIKAYSKDVNTMLDKITGKKTIPGLRSLIEYVENNNLLDQYTICKIKKDFDIDDVNGIANKTFNIAAEAYADEEN